MHFNVPTKDTCCQFEELQFEIVAETNDPEQRGEFELEKKLHRVKAPIKKKYPLYHFGIHLELINFDYLETIIYGLDPL